MAVIVNLNQPEVLPLLRTSQQRWATPSLFNDSMRTEKLVRHHDTRIKHRFHLKRQR